MAKNSLFTTLVPLLLSIIAVVLIALLFAGGSHPHVLNDFYFFETQTDNLKIASRLENSTFLKALQKVSGTDLTGSEANASTLALLKSYKVALLNACAQNSSYTKCGDAKLGFHFDPIKNLSLDSTSLKGSVSKEVYDDLSAYETISPFLAAAYIIAGVLLLISPVILACSSRHPRLSIFSGAAALGATVFLAIASIAAPATFAKLVSALNKSLGPNGLKSSLGSKLFIVSWIATVLALIGAIIIISGARSNLRRSRATRSGKQPKGRPFLGKLNVSPRSVSVTGEQGEASNTKKSAMTPISAFMRRVPTWNRHQYTQVERQPAVKSQPRRSIDDDQQLLVKADTQYPTIAELEEEQGYALEAPRGIALHTLPGRTTRDADTVYEPYR